MTVVEIGLMGVKPNHDVMNPDTDEGKILQKAWNAVTETSGGPHWAYGGLDIHDRSRLWGFFEFDSVKHHEEFARTFGAEAVEDLPKIGTHSEFQKHFEVEPSLQTVLKAPVVEVVLTYFTAGISVAERDEIAKAMRRNMGEALMKGGPGVLAMSSGWSVEDDFRVLDNFKGEAGVALALFIGWGDKNARDGFRSQHERNLDWLTVGQREKVLDFVVKTIECKEFGKRKSDAM